MKPIFGSLRSRLTLIILLAVIPPILIAILIASYHASNVLYEEAEEKLALQASSLADNVLKWDTENVRILKNLSVQPAIVSMEAAQQKMILEKTISVYKDLYLISTITLDGLNLARSDDEVLKNYRDRSYFKDTVAGRPIAREILISRTTNQPAVVFSAPIKQEESGKTKGVIMLGAELTVVSEKVQAVKLGDTGFAFVVNEKGQVLAHPEQKYASELKNVSDYPPVKELLAKKVGTLRFQDPNKIAWLSHSMTLSNGWGIIVQKQEQEVLKQVTSLWRLAMIIFVNVLLVVGILTWLVANRLIRPIERVTEAAIALARGQLDQTIVVERHDELGILAESFNDMANQLKRYMTALEVNNRELQRLHKLKDEFLANTSHELKTPLNGIIDISESLLLGTVGELPEKIKSHLIMIVNSGRRLANLINDILDFSKLRHKTVELSVKPIQLHEIVEVVFALSKPLIFQRQFEGPLKLINSVPPDLPPVCADENRLYQILHNLVSNAIKFTKQGQVEIRTTLFPPSSQPTHTQVISELCSTRFLVIAVADTGIGIPEDKLESIFISYERGGREITKEYGGTGLGLAITKQLVLLHGGQIWVESKVDVGSQFCFTLPLAKKQAVESTYQPAASSSTTTQPPKKFAPTLPLPPQFHLLVVDDEPINLQVLDNYLSLMNYTITKANSGLEALELIDNGLEPDLIILDVMMPKMSGYDVVKKLRERWQAHQLPILLLTARSQVTDLVIGLDSGANDFLTKPINKDELIARVKTHLHVRELQQRALQLAMQNEERLRKFFDALPVGVFILDHEGKPYYINRRGEEILGRGLIPGSHPENLPELYRLYLAGTDQLYPLNRLPILRALYNELSYKDDMEVKRPDKIVPIEVWGKPLSLNEDRPVEYAVAIFQDITERKQAELERAYLGQERELKNAQLVKLNQEKNEFLGIAAHDLKNPLSGILGIAEILQDSAERITKDEIIEYATIIEMCSQQMFDLITNLLDVNMIESGNISVNLQPVNLLPVIQKLIRNYSDRARAKNLTFKFQPVGIDYIVHADPKITYQVLENLISNAVKYSIHGKTITIILAYQEKSTVCMIQDEGPGLSEKDQKKLFGKFTRLSSRPTGDEHSTGLGLFIVKKLVDIMGCKVHCESELGKGSTFIVEFPTQEDFPAYDS